MFHGLFIEQAKRIPGVWMYKPECFYFELFLNDALVFLTI